MTDDVCFQMTLDLDTLFWSSLAQDDTKQTNKAQIRTWFEMQVNFTARNYIIPAYFETGEQLSINSLTVLLMPIHPHSLTSSLRWRTKKADRDNLRHYQTKSDVFHSCTHTHKHLLQNKLQLHTHIHILCKLIMSENTNSNSTNSLYTDKNNNKNNLFRWQITKNFDGKL